ncbi:unnamed protein product [Peniophora sp. CBMAI 1063]|nr:unnamed protein product [Peniophora sp. CBMAI 1063]
MRNLWSFTRSSRAWRDGIRNEALPEDKIGEHSWKLRRIVASSCLSSKERKRPTPVVLRRMRTPFRPEPQRAAALTEDHRVVLAASRGVNGEALKSMPSYFQELPPIPYRYRINGAGQDTFRRVVTASMSQYLLPSNATMQRTPATSAVLPSNRDETPECVRRIMSRVNA